MDRFGMEMEAFRKASKAPYPKEARQILLQATPHQFTYFLLFNLFLQLLNLIYDLFPFFYRECCHKCIPIDRHDIITIEISV